ncbi:MAG: acyl-CoA desaturase [Cytophagales bacterium]|nr:MAG: acyl-CoA desaturase [Cytophagales bacterium]TAH29601.1 MAG: acyl-CoA desaturase [Cytophagales bacterium]
MANTYQKPKFAKLDRANFFPTLKKRIDGYFKDNNIAKQGNFEMFLKTMILLTLYLVPYILILTNMFSTWAVIGLLSIIGFAKAGIGMAIMHDANHGAYSSKSWINNLFGGTMYLIGGSPTMWKIQHNVLHHTYTNVLHVDEDIETKFILRLSPYAPLKPIHKHQYWYAFLLYGLMTFSFLIKDFIKVFRYKREQGSSAKYNTRKELFTILGTKVVYLFLALVIPFLLLDVSFGWIFLSFLFVHHIVGMILSIVFQLAHLVEITNHHTATEESQDWENTWAIHQLETTADFARKNSFLNWYLGGLNYQVEHHLFPNICHVHYSKISDIVKETAQEYGITYNEYPTFMGAFVSHIRVLKWLGKTEMVNA